MLVGAKTSLPENGNIVYTELTEFIGVAMKISIFGGLILALPVIIYQGVIFIAPGLRSKEKRYLYILLPLTILSFVAGATFGFKILIPPAVGFLISFGGEIATPMIRIGNVINLMITLLFWMCLIFQLPLLAFFFTKIGIVTPKILSRQRRYAVVVAFILGAIITPTFDPINQTLVALPIIVLYEAGILLSRIAYRGKNNSKSK